MTTHLFILFYLLIVPVAHLKDKHTSLLETEKTLQTLQTRTNKLITILKYPIKCHYIVVSLKILLKGLSRLEYI